MPYFANNSLPWYSKSRICAWGKMWRTRINLGPAVGLRIFRGRHFYISAKGSFLKQVLPLRIPICAFDAKTGILCAKCQAKLSAGQISNSDIIVSKVLVKLAESVPDVNKMGLLRSYEVEGSYVLEMEQADASLIRSKPEIKQKLEDMLKGKVWVIGTSNSDRQFLEELFYPIRILTVNTVWLPDGSKLTKVIIPGKRPERLRGEIEALKKVVKYMKGIELIVESEREATLRL
jgi:transcription antitermination factor NusA-like protein